MIGFICFAILCYQNPVMSLVQPIGMTNEQYQLAINAPDAREQLFDNYYEPSPNIFISHGTLYGSDNLSVVELSWYGEVIRQQMGRGFVLTASGMYSSELDNQSARKYYELADMYRTGHGVVPITYEQLNQRQKRLYDITEFRDYEIYDMFIDENQADLTEKEALDSDKYVGFVSTKSPNDIGRRFFIYSFENSQMEFQGLVLVTGTAKRSDWTGLEKPTNKGFYFNPLIIRYSKGVHWGFDLTYRLYELFGGTGGPTNAIIAIDPDSGN